MLKIIDISKKWFWRAVRRIKTKIFQNIQIWKAVINFLYFKQNKNKFYTSNFDLILDLINLFN